MAGYQRRAATTSVCALSVALTPYTALGYWLDKNDSVFNCLGYVFASASVILTIYACCRNLRWLYFLHFPFFLLATIVATYTWVIGGLPGYPIAFVLMTTTWEEVRGFFTAWPETRLVIGILAAASAYLLGGIPLPAIRLPTLFTPNSRWALIAGAVTIVAVGAQQPDRFVEGMIASPFPSLVSFLTGPLSSAHTALHGPSDRKRPFMAKSIENSEVHVLVIGESSRRKSWSLYGYGRQTTPYLDSIRNELVVFNHAVADANVTAYAVPLLLSGLEPDRFNYHAITGTIVDLARASGYHTAWLVNQDPGISYLVGIEADDMYFSRPPTKPGFVVYPPDGILLTELTRILAKGGPLFVGLHTYGSHSPYVHRFPSAFAHFYRADSPNEEVDAYDDSILYMDWMLKEIIERLRRLDISATLTYVSDHGEELYQLDGRSGHGQGDYSANAFEIPAFVWMSAHYRNAHPRTIQTLRLNAGKMLRSHQFFFLLADLMEVRWNGRPDNASPIESNFNPDQHDGFFAGGTLVHEADTLSP